MLGLEDILSQETINFTVKMFKTKLKNLQSRIINHQDAEGFTPMHLASFYGDFLCVQFLVRYGGDPYMKDHKENKSVLDYAKNGSVRKVLTDLQEAAQKGDVHSFDFLLVCGNKIDERKSIFTISPLHNVDFSYHFQYFQLIFRQLTKQWNQMIKL